MADSPPLRVPADASPDEAAAIVAAVEQLLAAEARAARDATADGDSWAGRRFAFAGRLNKVGGRVEGVPDGIPPDAWTAAGRAERLYRPR